MSDAVPGPRSLILARADEGTLTPLDGIEGGFIRLLSAAEADQVRDASADDANYLFFIAAICDAAGKPLFGSADIDSLKAIKATHFNAMLIQALAVNNANAKATADLAKN